MTSSTVPISLAVFVPQSRLPSNEDINRVQKLLVQDARCRPLADSVRKLEATYELLCTEKKEITHLTHGRSYAKMLAGWVDGIVSSIEVANARSAIHSLPLLMLIQFTQFLEYLDITNTEYGEIISQVRDVGGLQGYCGGLAAAIAIACATSIEQAVDNACIALHVTFCIGLMAELGDDSRLEGVTTVVVRLKYEGQSDELVKLFPQTYVGAVNDARSVTVVGPSDILAELRQYAIQQGMLVQEVDIRGKTHNPENKILVDELVTICQRHVNLTLPEARCLQTPLRSNKDGSLVLDGSLTAELIRTILVTRCEWYTVVNLIADDFARSPRDSHNILSFGIGDSLTMSPFHRRQVQCTKVDIQRFLAEHALLNASDPHIPPHAAAIIGVSCRFPGADDFEKFWQLVSEGVDTHQELSTDRFDLPGSFRATQSASFMQGRRFWGNFLGDVKSADREFFGYNSKEMLHMDPQQRLLLELAHEAMESGGLYNRKNHTLGSNVGCFIGASFVDYVDNTSSHATTAYNSTGTLRTFLSGRLSYKYGWSGPCEVLDTACSSSLVAINRAYIALQSGECNIAVCGGVNIISSLNNYLDLAKTGFLSPSGQCKPFDQSADGYCRSEGGGLIILKPYAAAVADGDTIYGVMRGTAVNHGSSSSSITTPDTKHQTDLYRRVLTIAELKSHDISYVEAHGTGTQAGDPVEMYGIRTALGGASRPTVLSIGSIKANIGHAETAAGVAGLLKVVAMLQKTSIPPLAQHRLLNRKIPPLEPDRMVIDTKPRHWNVPYRSALVNSYGAAGSNASCICSEPPHSTKEDNNSHEGETYPIIISAATLESLQAYALKLSSYLSRTKLPCGIGNVAFTLSERRKRFKYCMTGVSSTTEKIVRDLVVDEYSTSDKPVIFCFSGQGSEVPQLNERFFKEHPSFKAFVEHCDLLLAGMGFPSVSPIIFHSESVPDIITYQISHVVVQLAFAKCWVDSGLCVKGVVGHSLGELAALGFCEILSLEDCLRLVAARAGLMHTMWGKDRGGMIAIHADDKFVQQIIKTVAGELPGSTAEIACYNSSTNHVLAGDSDAMELAEKILGKQKLVRFQRIKTSHGFHTALTEPFLEDLEDFTSTLIWRESKYPLEMCSAQPTDTATAFSPSKHAREPVYFEQAVKRLESRLGPSLWMEAGVNGPVISIVRSALRTPMDHEFINLVIDGAVDPSKILSQITVKLWKLGLDVQPWHFITSNYCPYETVWLPPYQFNRSQMWLENIDRAKLLLDSTFAKAQQPTEVDQGRDTSSCMVTPLESLTNSRVNHDFKIDTAADRFQRLTRGHCVQGQPMCPASLYLECVSMAYESLLNKVHHSEFVCIKFDNIAFLAPLKMDVTRVVQLRMTMKSSANFLYEFTISSRAHVSITSDDTTHCRGTISTQAEIALNCSTRLLSRAVQAFSQRDGLEKLARKRAYKLFSRVVDYEEFFQGIASIRLGDSEAYAEITLPNRDVCSVEGRYIDAVTADCFVQVAGLLANSSDDISSGEVLLAASFDKAEILLFPQTGTSREEWKVFAQISPSTHNKAQYVGDVYAFTPDDHLAAVFEGCRFDKISIERLKKVLGNAIPTQARPATTASQLAAISQHVPSVELKTQKPYRIAVAATEITSDLLPQERSAESADCSDRRSLLKQILMSHLGLSATAFDKLDRRCPLDSLGVDSLASVEIAGELTVCGIQISGTSLMELSINDLEGTIFRESTTSSGHVSSNIAQDPSAVLASQMITTNGVTSPKVVKRAQPGTPKECDQDVHNAKSTLRSLISTVLGIEPNSITDDTELQKLGVDSLCLVELKAEFATALSIQLGDDDITFESTISTLVAAASLSAGSGQDAISSSPTGTPTSNSTASSGSCFDRTGDPSICMKLNVDVTANIEKAIDVTNQNFDTAAQQYGFSNYWSDVSPSLNKLLVKYIADAFQSLGVNLARLTEGSQVALIPHLPKHSRVVQRFYDIMQQHSILDKAGSDWVRGSAKISDESAADLHAAALRSHPSYSIDIEIMAVTGTKLAECLAGKENPVALLFGNPRARDLLNKFYRISPMLNALTEQLLVLMEQLVKSDNGMRQLRILEVGGGTGGTTSRLAPLLQSLAPPELYSFTDISSTLTRQAVNEFGQFNWMDYRVFNLEEDVPSSMKGSYDIAIATNCVHATRSRTESLRKIYEALKDDGVVILSEQTRTIDWYDIVFGLLDGWWYSDGGRGYPIRTALQWENDFRDAGFSNCVYTSGPSLESISQQLLVGSKLEMKRQWGITGTNEQKPGSGMYECQTFEYKKVDGVPLQADVFLPRQPTATPMPICLMIHGGGYMALSRKSIRLSQVTHLVSNGVLPVSIDYRLCPGVSVIDGPMLDVRDSYIWMIDHLPSILLAKGIHLDPSRVGVVGWSTGGHLAMTLAWSLQGSSYVSPKAILPFYSPVDFENLNSDIAPPEHLTLWKPSMSVEQALQAIPSIPVTAYHGPGSTEPVPSGMRELEDLGCMHKNDARSELIALLFRDPDVAQPLLFYGKNAYKEMITNKIAWQNSVAQISPLARLRAGEYNVPTLLVHGDKDEIAPFVGAQRFSTELQKYGISGGLLRVPNAKHLFDLRLSGNDALWRDIIAPAYEFLLQHLHTSQ